jgi:hypothetical protein
MKNAQYFFGSALVRYEVPEHTLDSLNHLADQLIHKGIPEKLRIREQLASAVNAEVEIPLLLVREFSEFVFGIAGDYHRSYAAHDRGEPEFQVDRMWVVSQREGEWNYLHSHLGDLSGVLYLRVPENMAAGLPENDKRSLSPGAISFTEGVPGPYRKSIKTFHPKVGDLYLFPSELTHTVYPFFGPEERRSLSFNLRVISQKKSP